jgi:hypothetical protein
LPFMMSGWHVRANCPWGDVCSATATGGIARRLQLFANAAIAASRVGSREQVALPSLVQRLCVLDWLDVVHATAIPLLPDPGASRRASRRPPRAR